MNLFLIFTGLEFKKSKLPFDSKNISLFGNSEICHKNDDAIKAFIRIKQMKEKGVIYIIFDNSCSTATVKKRKAEVKQNLNGCKYKFICDDTENYQPAHLKDCGSLLGLMEELVYNKMSA